MLLLWQTDKENRWAAAQFRDNFGHILIQKRAFAKISASSRAVSWNGKPVVFELSNDARKGALKA